MNETLSQFFKKGAAIFTVVLELRIFKIVNKHNLKIKSKWDPIYGAEPKKIF